MRRKEALATGEVYHVFSKSIAGYRIFCDDRDFTRMKQMLYYYRLVDWPLRFSDFVKLDEVRKKGFRAHLNAIRDARGGCREWVQMIAYCVMPTHLHLVLKQLMEDGITEFMGDLLNSFTRYFNLRRARKGPLWEGPFKNVRVESDDQLLHLTRYVHLNPVTAFLTERPEDWKYSSYREYISGVKDEEQLCSYESLLAVEPTRYKQFVHDRIGYQRELEKIKHLALD